MDSAWRHGMLTFLTLLGSNRAIILFEVEMDKTIGNVSFGYWEQTASSLKLAVHFWGI